MADIVLINPRFDVSYWGLEHAVPFLGVKAVLPVACLPLVAALTPAEHRVTLVDENIEPIDFDRCARADIVGITGMNVQRRRMREILAELKSRGVFTVVGGPYVTVQEGDIADLADVVFIGEAEETWPRFLAEWREGRHQRRYEQAERTDMATVPAPRLDLLKMKKYAFASVQFSRGCPFSCEFCDIIVTFGRRPRIKTSAQVLAELDAIVAAGMNFAFVVDDNLIGNKRAIKAVLREVVAWQQAKGYPLMFATEASVDLADEPELMQLMVDANFSDVFVGIESPNEASLRETKKTQNLRDRGGTMLDKVHRIQDVGMEVWCGIIVGFDNDDPSIFAAQRQFVQELADHQRNREHAGSDPADSTLQAARRRRPAGRRGRSGGFRGVWHQCPAAAAQPRRVAIRICQADARAQRAGGVFRAGRGALYRGPSASWANSGRLYAPPSAAPSAAQHAAAVRNRPGS